MKRFEYVGPEEIRAHAMRAPSSAGTAIVSNAALHEWLGALTRELREEDGWCTYVITTEGTLRLAPRRSEHVACASGASVAAAGELRFDSAGAVTDITNLSSGYCPDETCWDSVGATLDSLALKHPQHFTFVAKFRRCPRCAATNLVKDDWFQCTFCGSDLPRTWNIHALND